FYGGQLGLRGEKGFGRFFVQATGRVALGVMHQEIAVDGFTVNSLPGAPLAGAPGGLLAQASNIGRRESNSFCVVPEVGVNLGYNIPDNLRIYGGYTFLYPSRVARPGDQVSLAVNSNQVPTFIGGAPQPPLAGGPALPAPPSNHSDFWAQGVVAGLELRW